MKILTLKQFIEANKKDKIKVINASKNDDLKMFKYMHAMSDWSDPIVRQARGIVFDLITGETVIKSFDKFFNYNQNEWMRNISEDDEVAATTLSSIKTKENKQLVAGLSEWPETFKKLRVYDKLDGSIMNVSVYKNELICTSSGSIDGIYPTYFKNALLNHLDDQIEKFKEKIKGKTLVFEFINPGLDPHIVDYKKNDLILLGMFDNKTYFDYEFTNEINQIANNFNFNQPKQYTKIKNLNDLQTLLKHLEEQETVVEGVVAVFLLLDDSIKRLKFKTPTYLKLHRQLDSIVFSPYTKANAIEIYKMFEDDIIDDLLAQYRPSNGNMQIIAYYKSLFNKHYNILNQVNQYLKENQIDVKDLDEPEKRKQVMKYIGQNYGSLGIMFVNQFYNGNDLSKIKISENEHLDIWFRGMIKKETEKLRKGVNRNE